jgi:uncharacterized protein (DUF1330 family)
MAAYALFDNIEVSDPARIDLYKALVAPIVTSHGGRYVVLGGRSILLEGVWKPSFPVMIEFPDLDRAQRWYDSAEYRDLKALRASAGRFNAVLIEGLGVPPDVSGQRD